MVYRGFVLGALAPFIGADYVIVIVGAGQLIGASTGDALLVMVATVITAVAFAPLRAHLQGLADRPVYGHRTNPYEVLASVTSRMSSVTTGRAVLREVACGIQPPILTSPGLDAALESLADDAALFRDGVVRLLADRVLAVLTHLRA